jgi:hypothetical protein
MAEEKKMTKCFMNGKSCIYERLIDESLGNRNKPHDKHAFVIMPFGEQLDVLYQWEIAPFLKNGGEDPGEPEFKCTPERADDVRQVGFIICEKICKRIQEADYVVVDVSFDNPNVFYEFGLSVALRKQILPICVGEKCESRLNDLKDLIGIDKLLPYPKFDMLEERISKYIWDVDTVEEYKSFEQMSGDKMTVLYDDKHVLCGCDGYDEEYGFGSFCKTAVGTAISQIFSKENTKKNPNLKLYDKERIEAIKKPEWVDATRESYKEVIKKCKDSACVLVDVSMENSIGNYFWLGYIHGIGGYAIPVNSYKPDTSESGSKSESKVAFDIRALWHIMFREDHPMELSTSLNEILEYIYIQKAKYLNRTAFWEKILGDNKVSIFLGSLYLEDLGRNTIGDWDYRTAAEITNYLSSSKETMKVTLESPLPKRESPPDNAYIEWLQTQLKDNSIIVASADVNDLTEIALCEIMDQAPFQKIPKDDDAFKGYIAHKKYSKETKTKFPETAFYSKEYCDSDERGFIIRDGIAIKKSHMQEHAYPGDPDVKGAKQLLGQLVVSHNPFADGKWIVIISGISGPATLGIAQMLTGCMYNEFTINDVELIGEKEKEELGKLVSKYTELIMDKDIQINIDNGKIPYDSLSEYMLGKILKVGKDSDRQINALVAVNVYYPPKMGTQYSNDERKVIAWDFSDLKKVVGTVWPNPNNLNCSYSEKEK